MYTQLLAPQKRVHRNNRQMNKRTLKVIIILVGLLFLNIEAAQAGLIHKFKVYIGLGLQGYELFYATGIVFVLAVLSYIICVPGIKQRNTKTITGNISQRLQAKKTRIKKISAILNNLAAAKQPQF